MKKATRQLNIIFMSLVLLFSFGVTAFAKETVKIPNDLTVSPIRIFFACVVIVGFVVMEILFDRIRNKRIEKRNNKK
jgi:hypothetical protein